MSTGTSAGLLDSARAQSVFKHQILESYLPPFVRMTGSQRQSRSGSGQGNRIVLLDGYAGRGRYPDGAMASGERMLLAAQKARPLSVEVVLVERNRLVFQALRSVTEEYCARGVVAEAQCGDVEQHLDDVLDRARGVPLFMFLDPCGRNLPFDVLAATLNLRCARRPPTEALLNISADLIRRAAGIEGKQELRRSAVLKHVDTMCGGDWWRPVAIDAHAASRDDTWESAAETVVQQYADRLATATGMLSVVVPVRRRQHHQPVYHLVFLTRSEYGLWVFGNAVATARQKWLEILGPSEDEVEGMLFNTVDCQLEGEKDSALRDIRKNLLDLTTQYPRARLVEHTMAVFGTNHGVAQEKLVRQAARDLQKQGLILLDTTPKQLRDWVIRPAPKSR